MHLGEYLDHTIMRLQKACANLDLILLFIGSVVGVFCIYVIPEKFANFNVKAAYKYICTASGKFKYALR